MFLAKEIRGEAMGAKTKRKVTPIYIRTVKYDHQFFIVPTTKDYIFP
jgi:hypothetical protein